VWVPGPQLLCAEHDRQLHGIQVFKRHKREPIVKPEAESNPALAGLAALFAAAQEVEGKEEDGRQESEGVKGHSEEVRRHAPRAPLTTFWIARRAGSSPPRRPPSGSSADGGHQTDGDA